MNRENTEMLYEHFCNLILSNVTNANILKKKIKSENKAHNENGAGRKFDLIPQILVNSIQIFKICKTYVFRTEYF